MDIKLIALDLDRTTLNSKSKLSQRNKEALINAINKGIHVCIASGRAFDTLPKEVLEIPGIEYAITSNGAAVYEIKGKKCLKSYKLTPECIDIILDISRDYPVTYEAFIDGKAFASKQYIEDPVKYGATPHSIAYVQSTRTLTDDIVDFIIKNRDRLDCIDIVINDDILKQRLIDEIGASTKDVYITSSIKQLIEISYKDAGKKSGVKFLSEFLGIDSTNVAAFGDADNDLDMIEYAGCGIAMENASESLKAKADYITLHHDEDGVAYAFENILGIKP